MCQSVSESTHPICYSSVETASVHLVGSVIFTMMCCTTREHTAWIGHLYGCCAQNGLPHVLNIIYLSPILFPGWLNYISALSSPGSSKQECLYSLLSDCLWNSAFMVCGDHLWKVPGTFPLVGLTTWALMLCIKLANGGG